VVTQLFPAIFSDNQVGRITANHARGARKRKDFLSRGKGRTIKRKGKRKKRKEKEKANKDPGSTIHLLSLPFFPSPALSCSMVTHLSRQLQQESSILVLATEVDAMTA
jgi:hypothetical protein